MATATIRRHDLLKQLGIQSQNSGAYDGAWRKTGRRVVESFDPATGRVIARVRQATRADYDACAAAAHEAFQRWRNVPAPSAARSCAGIGERLREHKDRSGAW
jgi:acyl-CoA reductase-like NAD-dependent aldehyde dehydrogenase